MNFFKILKGNSSRISTDITPFHDGWVYFTPDDGGLYIDFENDSGEQSRIRVRAPGSSGGESVAVPGVLRADAWSNGTQRLLVDGLTASQNGVIGVSHDITMEQFEACGYGGLCVCKQGNGYLDIVANGDIPTCDIPVVVILLG